jgi:hypothetical protein
MAYGTDNVSTSLRTALLERTTRPTGDVRRRTWRTFQRALERHLARKRGRLSPIETRR